MLAAKISVRTIFTLILLISALGTHPGSLLAMESARSLHSLPPSVSPASRLTSAAQHVAATLAVSGAPNAFTQKIASTWVRNASEYVFHNDLRSFLEIVVNACDATVEAQGQPEKVVGKFGMGFYSIFSLLDFAPTQGTTIELVTTYQDSDQQLQSYALTFSRGSNGDVSINHQSCPAQGAMPGTQLVITPKNGSFPDTMLQELRRYVHYLAFYPHLAIALSTQTSQDIKQECVGAGRAQVKVTLSPTELVVQDSGTGISLDCALTKLLIPSASSKRRANLSALREQAQQEAVIAPKILVWSGKANTEQSNFIITVNGVVVICKPLPKALQEGDNVLDLVIAMPQATQLTLARDELAISTDGLSFEEATLKRIIRASIQDVLADKADRRLLPMLYRGLDQWESMSAAHHIRGTFTGFFRKELNGLLEAQHVIPAPEDFFYHLAHIAHHFSDQTARLLPLPADLVNYNFQALEAWIEQAALRHNAASPQQAFLEEGLEGRIIAGKHLIFVPDACLPQTHTGKSTISSLGLRSMLFIPDSYIAEAEEEEKFHRKYNLSPIPLRTAITKRIIGSYCELAITTPQHASAHRPVLLTLQLTGQQALPPAAKPPSLASRMLNGIKNFFRKLNPFAHKEPATILPPISAELYSQLKGQVAISILPPEQWSSTGFSRDYTFAVRGTSVPRANFLASALVSDYQHSCGTYSSPQEDRDGEHVLFSRALASLLRLHGIHNNEHIEKRLEAVKNLKKALGAIALLNTPLRALLEQECPALVAEINAQTCTDQQLCQRIYEFLIARLRKDEEAPLRALFILDSEGAKKLWPLPAPLDSAEPLRTLTDALLQNCMAGDKAFDPWSSETSALGDVSEAELSQLPPAALTLLSGKSHTITHHYLDKGIKREEKRYQILHPTCLTGQAYKDRPAVPVLPAMSEEDLQRAAGPLREAIAYADNYSATLVSKIPNIAIHHAVLPLKFLELWAAELGNHCVGQRIKRFVGSILGLYDRYYRLEEKDFAFVYGSNDTHRALSAQPDVQVEAAYKLLTSLANKNSALLDKALDLCIEDHIFQTSFERRADDLARKSLYQPSVLSGTPLSLLSKIQAEAGIDFVLPCLETARSSTELVLTSYVLLSRSILPLLKNSDPETKSRLQTAISRFVAIYLREKLDPETIADLLAELRPQESLEQRSLTLAQQPFMRPTEEYFKAVAAETSSFTDHSQFWSDITQGDSTLACRLSQLIKLHCLDNGITGALEEGSLEEIAERASMQEPGFFCDKIMQAIEAGSERAGTEASIIECLQNSIDAIKGTLHPAQETTLQASLQQRAECTGLTQETIAKTLTNVDIALGFVPAVDQETHSHLFLSITDRIGMPSLKTLLADLVVPDYSGKSPALGSVGVMGNGTFQIYQAATRVIVLTRTTKGPSKVYRLVITPLRNADGQVYDLELACSDVSSAAFAQNFYGTSINILFKPEEHATKNTFNALDVKLFLRSAAGAIYCPLSAPHAASTINICLAPKPVLALEQRHQTAEEALNPAPRDEDLLACHASPDGAASVHIYRRSNDLLTSYALTGGIPFMPLEQLVKEMNLLPRQLVKALSLGVIMNISPNLYHPVQSRTHLKMDDHSVQLLRRALLDALYTYTIQAGATEARLLNQSFTHFESSSPDFDQLRFSEELNQEALQAIEHFIENGTQHRSLNRESFFVHYRLSTIPQNQRHKSFYDHVTRALNVVPNALHLVQKQTLAQKTAFISQLTERICSYTPQELERAKQALREQLETHCSTLLQEGSLQAQGIFRQWQQEEQALNQQPAWLSTIVLYPWMAKKAQTWPHNMLGAALSSKDIMKKHFPMLLSQEEQAAMAAGKELYERLLPHRAFLLKIADDFLASYTEVFKELSPRPLHLRETRWVVDEARKQVTFYVGADLITVNFAACKSITELYALINSIRLGSLPEDIQRNRTYNFLFGTQPGAIGLLIHELEHAFRNTDSNVHGPATDAQGNEGVSFDACAVSFARKVIEAGLLSRWAKAFQARTQDDFPEYDTCKAIWGNLAKLETTNRKLLLELLAR